MKIDEVVQQTFTDALTAAEKKLNDSDRLEYLGKIAITAFVGVIAAFPPELEGEVISTIVATAKENAAEIRRTLERKLQ